MTTKRRLSWGLGITAMALGVTTGLSSMLVDGMRLDGQLAVAVCSLTETGSSRVVPFVVLLALAVYMADPGSSRDRRRRESIRLFLVMAVSLPGFALLNEHLVKHAFERPRPSHLRMVEAGIIPDPEAFHRLDKTARRGFLESRLAGSEAREAAKELAIHPKVLHHWIHETGYSFPSGHAFNAFIVAVLFLGAALANPTRGHRWLAGVMLVWAIAVSLSRVLLDVHRPVDVSVAALTGVLCGVLVLGLWWRWTQIST